MGMDGNHKEECQAMIDEHWDYNARMLTAHCVDDGAITQTEVVYREAMEHGYKHGIESGVAYDEGYRDGFAEGVAQGTQNVFTTIVGMFKNVITSDVADGLCHDIQNAVENINKQSSNINDEKMRQG